MSCTSTTRNSAAGGIRGENGSALLIVMSVGAIVTFMAFTWVAFSVRRSASVVDMRDCLRARYAAESVVSRVMYERGLGNIGPARANPVPAGTDSIKAAFNDSLVYYRDSARRAEASASSAEEATYLRVRASGTSGGATCTIQALFGRLLPEAYRNALILAEPNRRLDLRKGKIIGDVWLGQQPEGTVQGKIQTGAATLPAVDEARFASELKTLEQKMVFPERSEVVLQTSQAFNEGSPPPLDSGKDLFVNGNVLINGGSARPLVIRGPASIVASGEVQISGNVSADNVCILALGQVKCFDNVRLRDVTIYSQSWIYLDGEVRFSGYLYAYQTVILAGHASAELPSVAYIRGVESTDPAKGMFGLQLRNEARFAGTAFCAKNATLSIIEKNAAFTGLFYTKGNLALRGAVFGCVAAAMLAASVENQKNVLDGGTINRPALPADFTIPAAFAPSSGEFRVTKWDETISARKGT